VKLKDTSPLKLLVIGSWLFELPPPSRTGPYDIRTLRGWVGLPSVLRNLGPKPTYLVQRLKKYREFADSKETRGH
jgi:hypothetical protein